MNLVWGLFIIITKARLILSLAINIGYNESKRDKQAVDIIYVYFYFLGEKFAYSCGKAK